jgi:hypothetical protein
MIFLFGVKNFYAQKITLLLAVVPKKVQKSKKNAPF